MKKSLWVVLGLLSGCDWNWDEAETLARCTRGDCDGGVVSGDAGLPDAGTDGGPVDDGGDDAGTLDAGAMDAGVPDAGPADAGPADAGGLDAGVVDAGVVDAGVVDAGVVDAGVADAGSSTGLTAGCVPLIGLPAPPGNSVFSGRADTLISATAEAFGVAVDGETVWSVVKTADGGTEVYDACRLVYSGANAPRALHANGEVTRGLLLATGNEVLMITRDAGALSTFARTARLVALARGEDGGARAFILDENSSNDYTQTTLTAPLFADPVTLSTVHCSLLDLGNVEVLESAQGGSIVLTMNPYMCGTGTVADGLLGQGWQAQLISPAGTRSGFLIAVSSPTKVGRGSDGLRFAYRVTGNQVGTYRLSAAGFGTFLANGGLEGGSISGDLLSGIASAQLNAPFGVNMTFTEPTAFLGTINAAKPIITVGASSFDAGISHVVVPGGPTLVLWRQADGGVVLSTFQ